MSVSARVADCAERDELLAALRSSIDAANDVNNRVLAAAVAGDLEELSALDAKLRKTRSCSDGLLFAYRGHLREHGC